jgi:hypothetical protein
MPDAKLILCLDHGSLKKRRGRTSVTTQATPGAVSVLPLRFDHTANVSFRCRCPHASGISDSKTYQSLWYLDLIVTHCVKSGDAVTGAYFLRSRKAPVRERLMTQIDRQRRGVDLTGGGEMGQTVGG